MDAKDTKKTTETPKEALPQTPAPQAPPQKSVDTGANREFTVTLPSMGILYEGKLPGGSVRLRPMLTSEESILYSASGDGISKINSIINACFLSKEIDPQDLLLIDRFYILLMLRTRSFGGRYEFPTRCQFCNTQFRAKVNIAEDLEVNAMNPEVVSEPYDVELPNCGDTLQLRFLRGRDEARIARQSKRVRMQSTDPGDPSYLYRLALQIVGINGREVQLLEAEKYVKNLDMGDSAAIRIRTEELEGGVDTTIFPSCRNCGADNEIELPFTVEFFRPSAGGQGRGSA